MLKDTKKDKFKKSKETYESYTNPNKFEVSVQLHTTMTSEHEKLYNKIEQVYVSVKQSSKFCVTVCHLTKI